MVAFETEVTEDTDVLKVLHHATIPKIELNNSTIEDNSKTETCLMDQFIWTMAVKKSEKLEAHIDCIQFFNDNKIDINIREISAFENLLAFAETTPKQYENCVRQSYQIISKCFKFEGLGLDIAAK